MIIVTKIFDVKICQKYHILPNDTIVKIRERSIQEIISDYSYLIPNGVKSTFLRDLKAFILNGDNLVDLTFKKKSKNINLTIELLKYDSARKLFAKPFFEYPSMLLIKKSIAYVNLSLITTQNLDSILRIISNSKYLIIDVRSYPNFVPYKLASFINSDSSAFCTFKFPDSRKPGEFYTKTIYSDKLQTYNKYIKKVVLICNSYTQSRAEFSCMLLQSAPNVITIGSQTAGADGDILKIPMPKSVPLIYSSIGVYYPNGLNTFKRGIKIDRVFLPSINSLCNNKDEMLINAIKILEN